MKRNDVIKSINQLEKDVDLFIEELALHKPLTKSRFDLVDDLILILANLQLISYNMEINKKSTDYKRLVIISDKIARGK